MKNPVVVPEDSLHPPPRWQLHVHSADPPLLLQRLAQSRCHAEWPFFVGREIHDLWPPALGHSDDQDTKAVRRVAEVDASKFFVNVHHNASVFEVLLNKHEIKDILHRPTLSEVSSSSSLFSVG